MEGRPTGQEVSPPLAGLIDRVLTMEPAELAAFALTLDGGDLAVLEQALADAIDTTWRSTPDAMAAHLDPYFRRPDYVRLLGSKFAQLVIDRPGLPRSNRQIWNLPGRYGKSLSVQWGLTWNFDRAPASKSMVISYGDTLATEDADGIRGRLRFHADVLRCQLRRDRQRLDRFVTDAGGGLLAAGIDGTITGFGVSSDGVLVIDDPFKNWQQAHSEARREHVWNQYRGTLRNRLDDEDAGILVVHHRVHEDDLTARLVAEMEMEGDGEEWEVVSLPALAREGDLLGRAVGEPLDPERFPLEKVLRRHRALGSYLAGALEQQDPTPEEGTEMKRAWFRLVEPGDCPVEADAWLSSWDTKSKDRESGDFTVGQVWARTGNHFWLMDQLRGQWGQAQARVALALAQVRWPQCRAHRIEAAGYGPELAEFLEQPQPAYELDETLASRIGATADERPKVQALIRRGLTGITTKAPQGDKRVRARTVTPLLEASNVSLRVAGWNGAYLDEMAAFPDGAHDDQVDATSQALIILGGLAQAHVTRGRRRVATGAGVATASGRVRRPGR